MSIKVAINGFGRIGRCTLRAIYEQGLQNEFEVVAINASGDLATNAHLLKYDTTHGRFATSVETEGENTIIIDGKKIPFYSTKDPKGVNWDKYDGADCITPNVKELSDIIGHPVNNEDEDVVQAARKIMENPAYRDVKAVKNGRLVPFPEKYKYVMSQHITDAIEASARAVYPELFDKDSH